VGYGFEGKLVVDGFLTKFYRAKGRNQLFRRDPCDGTQERFDAEKYPGVACTVSVEEGLPICGDILPDVDLDRGELGFVKEVICLPIGGSKYTWHQYCLGLTPVEDAHEIIIYRRVLATWPSRLPA
jgi:hypothetical protein